MTTIDPPIPASPDASIPAIKDFAIQTAKQLIIYANSVESGSATPADQREALALLLRTNAKLIRYLIFSD